MLNKPQEHQCVWCETTHVGKCDLERDLERWQDEYDARRAKALQFASLPENGCVYVFDDKGHGAPYQMDTNGGVEIQGNKMQLAEQDDGWFVRCPDGEVTRIQKDRWLKPIAKDVVDHENVSNPFLAIRLEQHPDKSGNRYADGEVRLE